MALKDKVRERRYLWRDHVSRTAGPETPVVVYRFSNGRTFSEEPKRPYGKRK